jgi:succinate dehydrogenase/fumarate reductase cytochrome b subunit
MIIKIIVVLLLVAIVVSLGSGLVFLLRDNGDGKRTVKALTWRIGLSLLAFATLFVGYYAGLIQPHGIGP